MTMSRYLCPLNCGWHHDEDHLLTPPPQVTVDAGVLASGDLNAISSAVTFATMKSQLEQTESVVRTHLETHELLEWVQAVNLLRSERDLYRKEVGVSHEDTLKLHRMLGEQYEATQDAEQQVARIRAFLEDMAGWCSPHGVAADYSRRALDALDGVDPLGLAGPTHEELDEEQAGADRYADMVNAPLRPETIAAINERIKSGNLPVRKVRARVRYVGRDPAVLPIPADELQPLLALADDAPVRELTLPQVMELHRLTGRIIDEAQRERWQAAGRCGVCGFDGDRSGCQDCNGGPQ